MNKIKLIKAALDGLFQSLMIMCLGLFLVSKCASGLSLKQCVWLGVFCAIISASAYFAFISSELLNRVVLHFTLISMVVFIISIAAAFAIRLTFAFDIIPLRELSNSDGIVLIFVFICYSLISIVLRICVFVGLIIRNTHQTRHQK